jgi:hypothetical protein
MNRSCVTRTGLVLLLGASAFCPALQAGFRPEPQVITTETDGTSGAYAADLDADGDLDVLSASLGDDKTAWYENERMTCTIPPACQCGRDRYKPRDGGRRLNWVRQQGTTTMSVEVGSVLWDALDALW